MSSLATLVCEKAASYIRLPLKQFSNSSTIYISTINSVYSAYQVVSSNCRPKMSSVSLAVVVLKDVGSETKSASESKFFFLLNYLRILGDPNEAYPPIAKCASSLENFCFDKLAYAARYLSHQSTYVRHCEWSAGFNCCGSWNGWRYKYNCKYAIMCHVPALENFEK